MKTRSVIHCVKNFSEGMRPALQLDVRTQDFSLKRDKFQGNSRLKFPIDAGVVCDKAPVTTAMLTRKIKRYTLYKIIFPFLLFL
jgi:hypothetical protein